MSVLLKIGGRPLLVLGAILGLSACQTMPRQDGPLTQVSVRYDPYDYSMADIRANAKAECSAKGGSYVNEATNTPNLESPRWAYMTFDCFR